MVLPVHVVFFFFFLFLYHVLSLSSASSECPRSFYCGNLGEFWFPFTTAEHKDCGMLAIHGCEDFNSTKTVYFFSGKQKFPVTYINSFHKIVYVRDTDLQRRLENNSCDAFCCNITLPPSSPMGQFQIFLTITLYRCNNSNLQVSPPKQFLNYKGCAKSRNETIYFRTQDQDDPSPSLAACPRVRLPASPAIFLSGDPFKFITPEFVVYIQLSNDCQRCLDGGGLCRVNGTGEFFCSRSKVMADKRRALKLRLLIGFGVGLGILVLTLAIIFRGCKQRQKNALSHVRLRSINQHRNEPDPDSGRLFLGVPIFSYKELQDATNNFDPSNKLGDGGFGSVYYGKLQDEREVAVKHLFHHNYKRVEQFMTEVEILTRLRHKNLVSLYGCTSRQSHELLLVYEYIPNGTLASHLRGHSANPTLLTWPTRIKIAIETASALAYLHASGIIHRDVKTNNILLDNNFCVKVADFGLSRLFPDDVSHVSTAPQGTPGYLDPEYHFCFRLTNKSDVYSFGVVLMELISLMPAVDMGRNKDEITLANLAMRKIQRSEFEELVDPCLRIEKDSEVKKKVVAVGELAFQCLQINNEMRPSIDEVLDVLRKIESCKEDDENAREDSEDGGAVISKNEAEIQARPVTSINFDKAKLFKLPSSPNNMIEKWRNGKVDQAKLFSV
ncbi:LEAF RUST 10 DISEASE-RESISTANCE LOCUS RECEPTOR-LIKE PROTEIN KINASE-like 1.1 [Prosopis cineraria]|uniref:LEAF RUST 10 DISEASE-RESISTANCE LOCUS RECEPTOR-LIKE PROTEIN KINASE-like 1.1 n=1 Tax=Prosopis cineraria TaxID=364024 RepID=UPI00240F9BAE|nr:LEAF RUST 10 DISEASE-RESISTANCE LOCUS RECEPTOR-LIKE PROTEIN KINASE-like 1.1 [Prosopis cineraria]